MPEIPSCSFKQRTQPLSTTCVSLRNQSTRGRAHFSCAHKRAKRSIMSELGELSFTCDNFGRLWLVPSVAIDSTCSFNLG